VELPVELAPFLQHLEYRPATDTPLLGGRSQAEFVGWLRLRGDSPLDASALTVPVDALPPALYAALTAPAPVPTVAMSVQYAEPAPATRADSTTPGGGCWDGSRRVRRAVGGAWTTATCGHPAGSCWPRHGRPAVC